MRHIGRKLYHLVGGIGLLSLYYILGREHALTFYAVFFLIAFGLDLTRLKIPAVNQFVFTWFGNFIRKNEKNKLTGTAPYILGIGLSLYAYSPEVATAAVCFLAFGDVAATTVGERYGKTKIGDKSLEGSAAFIIAALVSGLFLQIIGVYLPSGVMVLGAFIAAGVEILPLPVNDNLLIPIVAGGIMELIMRLY
jgi:dolichol kinase